MPPDYKTVVDGAEIARHAVGDLGDALDEAFSDLGARHDRAVQRLLLAPAPDLPALAAKLALLDREQAWELPKGEECVAALERDAFRLCSSS